MKMISDSYRVNVSGYVNDEYVDIAGTAVLHVEPDGTEWYSDFIPKDPYFFDDVRMG